MRILRPGDADTAAAVLRRAAELDDAALADFMSRLGRRIRESGRPITAEELDQLLRSTDS